MPLSASFSGLFAQMTTSGRGGGVLKFFRLCPIFRWADLRGWPRFAALQPAIGVPRDIRAWGPLWDTYLATQSIQCI